MILHVCEGAVVIANAIVSMPNIYESLSSTSNIALVLWSYWSPKRALHDSAAKGHWE